MSRKVIIASALAVAVALCGSAFGEVRFGKNVYVGGHDFSHQTFDRKHRAEVHLYDNQSKNAGCRWQADGSGGRVKLCRLRSLHRD
ncbi:hypothetical protein OGR47_17765 [Methylocystis sp. MJC1]|uniref:hypothetical protein n=1 Tax=Methylocystis sp. MJC1 TaxID=2654282 RepID=UPI0013EE1523|nr:hypothetical protein [Methylocystis sp. MJC1]KAF2989988.1 hypothetical protein MJC1_02905 [Methylocystis sp. MJC1]MBU6528806.1 hypothetical protein [Methylocystis sp. MJC1]UZX11691.1 hypothetical protein OGR47_17765 [Methylocystis sp. MJC1]